MNAEWIATKDRMPCFTCFGFQTGKTILFRLDDGTEHEDIYQGWGIFGTGRGTEPPRVTHWKPLAATVTDDDVHQLVHESC